MSRKYNATKDGFIEASRGQTPEELRREEDESIEKKNRRYEYFMSKPENEHKLYHGFLGKLRPIKEGGRKRRTGKRRSSRKARSRRR